MVLRNPAAHTEKKTENTPILDEENCFYKGVIKVQRRKGLYSIDRNDGNSVGSKMDRRGSENGRS